jgi:hypothetical protein
LNLVIAGTGLVVLSLAMAIVSLRSGVPVAINQIAQERTEVSSRFSETERVVSAVTVEAARLIRRVSPYSEGANDKSRMAAASALLRWKLSRVRDIWCGNRKIRVRPEEIDKLRRLTDPPATVAVNDALAELRAEREAARVELQELRRERVRLQTLLGTLERTDPDFLGPLADATRHQLQQLDGARSSLDRAGNRGGQ